MKEKVSSERIAAARQRLAELHLTSVRRYVTTPKVHRLASCRTHRPTALAKFHPLARMGETSDIVDAVLYLQNATFVTGENIRVDGGVHAGR